MADQDEQAPLNGTKVLVTAGPTWVPIDRVRVITSIFTGNTGLNIARAFATAGAEVTLLLGPGSAALTPEDEESMHIRRFRYLSELAAALKDALEETRFDVIVHSAAVADYEPADVRDEKIPSGFDELQISLQPTKKLIRDIRKRAPDAFLIQFKLETGRPEDELVDAAWRGLIDIGGDIVVANLLEEITEESHKAYLIDPGRKVTAVHDKSEMAAELVRIAASRAEGPS